MAPQQRNEQGPAEDFQYRDERFPYSERVRRWNDLPDYTQDWIANLRKEDIKEIEDARKLMRSVRTFGSVWKIIFFGFFGAVIVVGPAFEWLAKAWEWIKR